MKYQLISQLQKYFSSLIYSVVLFLIFNVFFCFITPCYSNHIENQDNTGNKSFDDLHSIDFVKCQCGSQFVQKLYSQITNDIKNLPCLKAGNDITDQLNKLLEVPNFYDVSHEILKERNPKIKHSKKIDKLVRKTEDYRNKNFDNLKEEEKFNIKKLNRLLIEETYPEATRQIIEKKGTHIKNHILVIQKDGRLCRPESHGKEKLIKGKIYSEIFSDRAENDYIKDIIESINNWSPKNGSDQRQIVIFVHGGLNEFKDSYERANKLLFCEDNIPEDIYPIIINWESGIFTAYTDYVFRIRQGDTFYKAQKVAWTFASPLLSLVI